MDVARVRGQSAAWVVRCRLAVGRQHLALDPLDRTGANSELCGYLQDPPVPFASAFLMLTAVLAERSATHAIDRLRHRLGRRPFPAVIGNETEMVGRPANLPAGLDP